jgi:predicted nucleotidyltransferase component of viral defense system
MTDPRYGSPSAFRRAMQDRLKAASNEQHRPQSELMRQFILQRFLSRVFLSSDSKWVLKGGTGLLMRLPGSRHSKDLDLLHGTANMDAALEELREIAEIEGIDPFRFVLGEPKAMTGGVEGVTVSVSAYLGVTKVETFPIDLSTHLELVAGVDSLDVRPIIVIDDVDPLPRFRIYPLPDQIADKVCAMYSAYGPTKAASTRYRDLADLVTIVRSESFGANETQKALGAESARRGIQLPTTMELPALEWSGGYNAAARRFSGLPEEFFDVDAALMFVENCLGALLGGDQKSGVWNVQDQAWVSNQ